MEKFCNNPTLLDTLGWVQVRLSNIKDAAIILKTAATMQPDNQQVQYHYAVALSLEGVGGQMPPQRAKPQGCWLTSCGADLSVLRTAAYSLPHGG